MTAHSYKYSFLLLFCFCMFSALNSSTALAESISSAQLIEDQNYDGRPVVYAGEVIGDIMIRGEYAWINVHDGQNAIGIWAPKELSQAILFKGSYKTRGDWIEVKGVLNRTCKEHSGEFDIHATELRNTSPGYMIPHIFNRGRMNKAMVLLGVLICIWILRQLIKI